MHSDNKNSDMLGLQLRYDGEFYTAVAALCREIECLKPYRQSHASMSQHYKQLTTSLFDLQQKFKHSQKTFFGRLINLEEEIQNECNQKIWSNGQLVQLMASSTALQQCTKSLQQKFSVLTNLLKSKLSSRQQNIDTLNQHQTNINNISQQLSHYQHSITQLHNQLSLVQKQNTQLTSNNLPQTRSHLMNLLTKIRQISGMNKQMQISNTLTKQKIEDQKSKIDQYYNSSIPSLLNISKQQYEKGQVLGNKLGMLEDSNKLLKNKIKVEEYHMNNLSEQQEIITEMLVKKNMEIVKVNREISGEIEVAVREEGYYYQQNMKQLQSIQAFIQQLQNTNMMMLSKMQQVCQQDKQKLIDGVFADKCRKMAQMAGEVYLATVNPLAVSRKTGTLRKNDGSRVILKENNTFVNINKIKTTGKDFEKTGDTWVQENSKSLLNQ